MVGVMVERIKQARKPRSYASPKLCTPTHSLTGVKCRATSVAKNPVYLGDCCEFKDANNLPDTTLQLFGTCIGAPLHFDAIRFQQEMRADENG